MVTVSSTEIIACIDIEIAKRIVGTELALLVVVCVENRTGASIPPHVVVNQTETSDAVDVEVFKLEDVTHALVGLSFGPFVPDGCRERCCEQPVVCKGIVVAVAAADRKVGIVDFVEIETLIELHFVVGVLVDDVAKPVVVKFDMMVGVADANEWRAGAVPLDSALAESGRVGETAMIQNIVYVESANAHLYPIKGDALQLSRVAAFPHVGRFDTILATSLPIEEVDANKRTVDREVELGAGFVVKMIEVNLIAKENPSPSHVRAKFDGRTGGKSDFLPRPTTQGVALIGVSALQHDRIVVFLRLYVVGIGTVEIFYYFVQVRNHSLQPRFARLIRYRVFGHDGGGEE